MRGARLGVRSLASGGSCREALCFALLALAPAAHAREPEGVVAPPPSAETEAPTPATAAPAEGAEAAPKAVAAEAVEATANTAEARGSSSTPTYRLALTTDGPLLLLPTVFVTGWLLASDQAPAHCAPLCDRSQVFAFDRGAAGNYSAGWSTATDIAMATNAAAMLGALAVGEGLPAALSDALVVAEAGVWGTALAVMANTATRRPRPLMYSEEAPESMRRDPHATLSFFSGHASFTAGASTAAIYTLFKRGDAGAWPWVALGVGGVGTAFVATGRVLAGRHFPTDSIAGVLTGVATGLAIPGLHELSIRPGAVVTRDEARLTVSGAL